MKLLNEFLLTAQNDPRVTAVHISVYAVLFLSWTLRGCTNPVPVHRNETMQRAKISARSTYNKCMNELQEFGYIKYVPSANQFLQSLVYLMDPDEKMNVFNREIAHMRQK